MNIPVYNTILMIDYNLGLAGCTLLLCILIFSHSIVIRRRACRQFASFTEQTKDLEEIREKLNEQEDLHHQEESFHSSLKQAEVTTELQKPRSALTHNRHGQRPPERYHYAQSMFQSGIQIEEIASALKMSSHEISQLLKLAKLRTDAEKLNPGSGMLPVSQ